MPILNLDIVGDIKPRRGLAQKIADAAGIALGSQPQGTWVKLNFIDPALYAENEAGTLEDIQPIIINVLQANLPLGDELQTQISALTHAVAQSTGRPAENIHVIVEPAALGRTAFGGKLQR